MELKIEKEAFQHLDYSEIDPTVNHINANRIRNHDAYIYLL